MRRSLVRRAFVAALAISGFSPVTAWGEVTTLDSIRHQAATALADVDFARKHCPRVRIDEAQLTRLIARSRLPEADLRAGRDYRGQAEALAFILQQYGITEVCAVLPGRASYGAIP